MLVGIAMTNLCLESVLMPNSLLGEFWQLRTFQMEGFGHTGAPPAGHALWAEVGGSITFVTTGGNC